jgi:membrane protease YdiL (CAAX protease family)
MAVGLEELPFCGYLLPGMSGAFGRGDWLVNGVLFAAYHLHVPWPHLLNPLLHRDHPPPGL